MQIPQTEETLTEIFRKLGACEPEQWARSQIEEGVPQLVRFLFLKEAWQEVLPDGDISWIDREIAQARKSPEEPYAGLGAALARCRAAGADDADLSEIFRCAQAQMLFSLCYLLDCPHPPPEPAEDVCWALFQVDEEGRPVGPPVGGLHEEVLSTDPTGREMRPVHRE
ncbi:hypothetical protein SH611_06565 [Geminicoccaceae bacterium 1502E]|nr:hypothetical protein [Geminicoccaceae bacterium 1502E]